jgi:YbgC/YbaW family acyl-CoA thioester hydrolase
MVKETCFMKKSPLEWPTVSHQFIAKVYIHDTDCYGVVWHGHYLRWLETGRCQLLEQAGFMLQPATTQSQEEPSQWLYPVVEQHLQHKQFARLNDVLTITTTLINKEPRLVFEQTITRRGYRIREREENNEHERKMEPEMVCLQATITCVVLEANTQKLLRRLPEALKQALHWL